MPLLAQDLFSSALPVVSADLLELFKVNRLLVRLLVVAVKHVCLEDRAPCVETQREGRVVDRERDGEDVAGEGTELDVMNVLGLLVEVVDILEEIAVVPL